MTLRNRRCSIYKWRQKRAKSDVTFSEAEPAKKKQTASLKTVFPDKTTREEGEAGISVTQLPNASFKQLMETLVGTGTQGQEHVQKGKLAEAVRGRAASASSCQSSGSAHSGRSASPISPVSASTTQSASTAATNRSTLLSFRPQPTATAKFDPFSDSSIPISGPVSAFQPNPFLLKPGFAAAVGPGAAPSSAFAVPQPNYLPFTLPGQSAQSAFFPLFHSGLLANNGALVSPAFQCAQLPGGSAGSASAGGAGAGAGPLLYRRLPTFQPSLSLSLGPGPLAAPSAAFSAARQPSPLDLACRKQEPGKV